MGRKGWSKMTMTLKFDNGDTVIKHVEFPEGIILGIVTKEGIDLLEHEPLFLINGFIFSYTSKACLPEARNYTNSDWREFEDVRKHYPNFIEIGLNNVPEIRLQRFLERLRVGPEAKTYIKTLINSTKN